MPFQSEKQRRYLHANHPEIAKRWEQEYAGGGLARLRQAYPTNLTVGEEMTEMGTPLGNSLDNLYAEAINYNTLPQSKKAFTPSWTMIQKAAGLPDLYKGKTRGDFMDAVTQGKLGVAGSSGAFGENVGGLFEGVDLGKDWSAFGVTPTFETYGDKTGSGYIDIDKGALQDSAIESLPKGFWKDDEASLNTLSDNRYVDSGMFGTDATYVDDTNQGGISAFQDDYNYTPRNTMGNWSQFDDAESGFGGFEDADAEAAYADYASGLPTLKNKWNMPNINWGKAGEVLGTGVALANDAMPWGLGKRAWDTLTSGFSGGEPRDPDLGRGLSGNVSWAGQQYDKQHGVGAYKTYNLKKRLARLKKSKSTSDWNKKQRERVEKEIRDREAAAKASFEAKMNAAYNKYGGGNNQGGGGRYDGASSRAEYDANPTGFSGSS